MTEPAKLHALVGCNVAYAQSAGGRLLGDTTGFVTSFWSHRTG